MVTENRHRDGGTLEYLGVDQSSSGDPFWHWRFLVDFEPFNVRRGCKLRQETGGSWFVYHAGQNINRLVSPGVTKYLITKWLFALISDCSPPTIAHSVGYLSGWEKAFAYDIKPHEMYTQEWRSYYSGTNMSGERFGDRWGSQGAVRLRHAIAGIGADCGDVLIHSDHQSGEPAELYGKVQELEYEDYESVRKAMKGRGPGELFSNLSDYNPDPTKWAVASFLERRREWGKNLKTPYCRLRLLKPWVQHRSITEPISAASDEGAIWTLLHDVGCRLPRPR